MTKKKPKPSSGQKKLFQLLRDKAKAAQTLTREEIAKQCGWKLSTVRTYLNEGHFSSVIEQFGDVLKPLPIVLAKSDDELHVEITQSQVLRQAAKSDLTNPLSRSLAERSRDNMILALEVYNRPSLANRIDSFLVLFCMAWEQLLKAVIAERDGDSAIFTGKFFDGRRESISLQLSLDTIFSKQDITYKNISIIKKLRDEAVHLMAKEVEGILSRIFQSGIFNFADFYRQATGLDFLPASTPGLMTLISDLPPESSAVIISRHGDELGSEIASLIEEINGSVSEVNDSRFSIPIDYTLRFVSKNEDPDISLSHGQYAPANAVVVEKTVSEFKKFKYGRDRLVELVNSKLSETLSETELEDRHVIDSNGKIRFTTGHFDKIARKEKWRNADNEYHRYYPDHGKMRRFSDKALDFIVGGVISDKKFMTKY